jgi:hypothetical protein
MDFDILKLDLRAPLFYIRDDSLDPFGPSPFTGEYLFCFTLTAEQGFRIDPGDVPWDIPKGDSPGGTYLGSLIDRGKRDPSPEKGSSASCRSFELPQGKYLFAQVRERLNRKDSIAMAMEIQKEGLWERLVLDSRLYLRYLFEDQSPVTQVFRPFI